MNSTKSKFTGCILGLGLLLAAAESAHALQAVWDNTYTPSAWTRGSTAGSLYSEWNIFNDDGAAPGVQDTSPEVANFGGGSYQVAETTTTGFLTSGGNIYSFRAPTVFRFDVGNLGGGSSDIRDVYLRIGSLGNYDSSLMRSFTNFTLNGVAGSYTNLFNQPNAGGGGGQEVEALVSWLGVSNTGPFVLRWNAIGADVSLDQLSLDVGPVAPVPLPAAAYLMASGIAGIVALARRKKPAA